MPNEMPTHPTSTKFTLEFVEVGLLRDLKRLRKLFVEGWRPPYTLFQ